MKRFIFSFLLLLIAFYSHAQTTCEQMLHTAFDMTDKLTARMSTKTTASEDDIVYMEGLCKDATRKLNALAQGTTDKRLINEYRFCMLNTHSIMAYLFTTTGLPAQKVYAILEPIKEMAYVLDSCMMKEFDYAICTFASGESNVVSTTDYEKYALYFFYSYINACTQLGKKEEADEVFKRFKRFNYGMVRDMEYSTAGLMVRDKYLSGVFDEVLFDASSYALDRYTKDQGYDSVILSTKNLLAVLLLPQLVDSTIPNRADNFYKIYQQVRYYQDRHPDDIFTEDMQQYMFLQSMRSFSDQYGIPDLLESMKYNNHPVVDSIIALNDAVLLQRIIKMGERYAGSKLREPYFWQSMAKLYRAAGMAAEAEAADKKFKKYKYK